jgi:acyl carrier protein
MGLDLVETIMEIEDSFGVEITDEEASRMTTVGDLFGAITSKLTLKQDAGPCASMRAFHALRKTLLAETDLKRRDLRPGAALASLFPITSRIPSWTRVRKASSLTLPELDRPVFLEFLLFGIALASAIAVGWPLTTTRDYGLIAALAGLAVMVVTLSFLYKITKSKKTEFPGDISTLRDLTEHIAARNFAALCEPEGALDPDQAWSTMVQIISRQLGVQPEQVTRQARWVQDLGAD